jgi:hypothetical protein
LRHLLWLCLVFCLILSGCGSSTTDFKEGTWGMEIDEVMKKEAKIGNTGMEQEDSVLGDGIEIELEEVMVNGFKADASYIFKNEVDKYDILDLADISEEFNKMYKEYMNKNTSENRKEELMKMLEGDAIDKYMEEFDNVPDDLKLSDYILIEGEYHFDNPSKEDSDKILVALTEKYGKPEEVEDVYVYVWLTDRSKIVFDGKDYVNYTANYKTVAKQVTNFNSKRKSSNKSDL